MYSRADMRGGLFIPDMGDVTNKVAVLGRTEGASQLDVWQCPTWLLPAPARRKSTGTTGVKKVRGVRVCAQYAARMNAASSVL